MRDPSDVALPAPRWSGAAPGGSGRGGLGKPIDARFARSGFARDRGWIHEFEIRPGGLRVEITESSLMLDPARALETLTRLREIGVDVSIDDFGTGYSSLAYLKQLPLDELQIDRSFVRDVAVDDSDLAIVRSTIDLAHNPGLSVVAEGVEDEPTLALLRGFGCDNVQGYLFSRAVCAAELTRWLLDYDSRNRRTALAS